MRQSTNWIPVLFDGFLGAVVGGLVSFGVAIFVLRRTRRLDLDAAREQVSLRAAETLSAALAAYRESAERTTRSGFPHVREKSSSTLINSFLLHAPALTDRRLAALLDETRSVVEAHQRFSERLSDQAGRAKLDRTAPSHIEGAEERDEFDRTAFERLDEYLTYVLGAVGAYRSAEKWPWPAVSPPSFDDLAAD